MKESSNDKKIKSSQINPSYKRDNQLFDKKIQDDPLLDKKEIASFLKVSVKTIDKMVFHSEIPYLKVGRLVRFEKHEVLAWARRNTIRR